MIQDTLNERQKTHGDFYDVASKAQALKDEMRRGKNWKLLDDTQRETLEMIATKIARMLSGDPLYIDNVIDIIGYMELLKRHIEGADIER